MLIVVALVSFLAAGQPSATITKPKSVSVSGGTCRLSDDGTTLGVNVGPNAAMPTLALTIGPKAAMADALHANTTKFAGAGIYKNEIVAVYLGKTARDDSYIGLGTVTINADGKSGTFALNDGKAAGTFKCGTLVK